MLVSFPRIGALLAVNLLFLMMWGFAAIGKVRQGMPSWFGSKFGETILARFANFIEQWFYDATNRSAVRRLTANQARHQRPHANLRV